MKICLFDARPYDIEYFSRFNPGNAYTLKFYESKLNRDTVSLARGYNAVVVFVNDILDDVTLSNLDQMGIHLVVLRCAGYNNVDFKAAYGKIHVVRVPEYSPYAVAEHTAALMLCSNRKIHKAYARVRDNNFSITGLKGMDLFGKTVGIIGTGRIGRAFINICRGFGMHIVAYDTHPAENTNFEYVPLNELYSVSDVISLHCPLTPDTQHMINKTSMDLMKEGVMILNTSRGGLIDTEALINGLKDHHIGAAALDVYEEESNYFFKDLSDQILQDDLLSRLISFPNVLITSHQGFFTHEALEKIAKVTFDNIHQYETGIFLENEICYSCLNKDTVLCNQKNRMNCF